MSSLCERKKNCSVFTLSMKNLSQRKLTVDFIEAEGNRVICVTDSPVELGEVDSRTWRSKGDVYNALLNWAHPEKNGRIVNRVSGC